jgi:hypothetical protein
MQSMAFRFTSVSLTWLTALSTCSCSRWHSNSFPLGSQRCRHAHTVDVIQIHSLLCSFLWLTALSTHSGSRWHSHFRLCVQCGSRRYQLAYAVDDIQTHNRQLDLALGAVDVHMQSMAFRFASVQLSVAHGAVDSLTQPMVFRLSSVQLDVAHGAVNLLTHLMAFRFISVSLTWLTALLTCTCSRWHSDSSPCSFLWLTALSAHSRSRWHSHFRLCARCGSRRCQLAYAVDGIQTHIRAA